MDKKSIQEKLEKIEPVEAVDAVPPPVSEGEEASGMEAAPAPDEAVEGVPEGDLEPFRKAGWRFRRKAPGPVRTGAMAEPKKPQPKTLQLVRDGGDGRIKVLANTLNIRLDKALSDAQARRVIAENNLSIRRALGFSPNTFIVEAAPGESLNAARSMNERDDVSYAEPVLIEPIKGR